MGEHRPKRPAHLRVHVRQPGEKPLREIGQRPQQDGPHPAERVHVVRGAVRHRGTAKGCCHVRQAVAGEPRQRDAREREGLSIQVSLTSAPPGTASMKVRSKVALCASTGLPPTNSASAATAVRASGRARHVDAANPREPAQSRPGWGHPRVHERLKALRHLTATEPRGGDLYETAVLERESRGLRVQDDHVLLKGTKVRRSGPPRQAQVSLPHLVGRPRQQNVLERRRVLLGHALVVLLRGLERILHKARAQLRKLDPAVARGVRQQALGRHAGDGVGLLG